ncbi:uncharacterized protein LOC120295438 isoform X2 [Eucalyptus grandis]|uniref:uncharacterized protein LOC120295438 isoform X2 n=1 Tax=Eucalyptus grandis TaxID=71139 RepID=UPI00192EC35B|nr:uncharacterized protein LOC120295438 isoform X2 [Eucalyptus grandis]
MPGFAPPAESRLSPMMIVVASRVVGTRGTKLSLLCCVVLGGVLASLCCGSSLPTPSDQTNSRPVPSCSASGSWPMEVLVSLYQAVIPQLSNPVIFCDFLKKTDDIVGVVNAMGLGSLFILMKQYGLDYPCFYEKEDGESEAKDDMEEQIFGNRNDSTSTDFPKKPGFDFFHDASGTSKSFKPEVDLKAKSMNLLSILLVLVSLHQAFIPQLSNPIMFSDFSTRSYDIGGVVSVMALSSLFILMMQHGSEYRHIYEKVLGSCLKATLLPTFLAAAFAKKLSVLALSVLRQGALVIVAPIYSVFRQHSSINRLVHSVSSKRIATRSLLQSPLLLLLLLLLWVNRAVGENGTASYYGPPYERTECYGEGSLQFPVSNLFMAVGDGLWDLGAACGREYELRCIGGAQSGPGGCKPGANNIRVKVVDYALSVESAAAPRQSVTGTDFVLSRPAFEAIANPSVDSIKVEFKRL